MNDIDNFKDSVRHCAATAVAFIRITAITADVRFHGDDSLDRTVTIGSNQFVLARDAKQIGNGTIFQAPAAISLPDDTVEAKLHHAVEVAIAERTTYKFARNVASVLTRMLAYGVWEQPSEVDDPLAMLASAARLAPHKDRGRIARLTQEAHKVGQNEGVKRLSQALRVAPYLVNVVSNQELVRRVVAGDSPIAILIDHGGTKKMAALTKHSTSLITKESIKHVANILEKLNRNQIPGGKGQSVWLETMLGLRQHADPAPGFLDWLTVHAANHQIQGDITIARPSYYILADWAETTAEQQGGWNDRKSLPSCFAAALEWQRREEMRRDAELQNIASFPHVFDRFIADSDVFVEQITDIQTLIEVGKKQQNCMSSLATTFAAHANRGTRFYAVTRNVSSKGDTLIPGAIRSSVEVTWEDGNPVVRQHYGRANIRPTSDDIKAVSQLIAQLTPTQKNEAQNG